MLSFCIFIIADRSEKSIGGYPGDRSKGKKALDIYVRGGVKILANGEENIQNMAGIFRRYEMSDNRLYCWEYVDGGWEVAV